MASVTQQTIATGNTLGHVTRPARALVGWMQQAEAQLMLAQRMVQLAGSGLSHRCRVGRSQSSRVAKKNACRSKYRNEPNWVKVPSPTSPTMCLKERFHAV